MNGDAFIVDDLHNFNGTFGQRDVKSLYKKARSRTFANFTGVDGPYEPPLSPEIHINTSVMTPAQAASLVINSLLGADE